MPARATESTNPKKGGLFILNISTPPFFSNRRLKAVQGYKAKVYYPSCCAGRENTFPCNMLSHTKEKNIPYNITELPFCPCF